MKKKLFLGLLAAAAVSFTACQKDEVISEMPQDNAIGFGTYVGRDAQTKATVTDKTEMEKETYPGFGVFAFFTGNANYSESATPNFMYNIPVTYTTGWDYTDKKYWPGGGQKVSFFAYAPYNASATISAATVAGAPTLTYSQPDLVNNQIDLLYATPVKNRTEGRVDFTFNHALSRIGFKAITGDNYRITISKITLEGDFNTTGTCSLEDGVFSSVTPTSDKVYTLNGFTPAGFTNTGGEAITATEGYMMVIPTDLSSTKIAVTVTYSYEYKVSNDVYATAVETTQSGTVGINLQQGKAYTLVLNLNPLSPITFNVTSVNNWDPEAGRDTPVVNN